MTLQWNWIFSEKKNKNKKFHQVLVEAQNVDVEYWKKLNLTQNYE